MAEYTGYQYRLRAGSPMPTSTKGHFVLHSFMAERQQIDIETCESDLVRSSAFRGQAGDGGLYAAQYSRLPLSEERYSSKITNSPLYIEEKITFP